MARPAGRAAAAAAVAAAAAAGPAVSPLHEFHGPGQPNPSYRPCLVFLRSSRTARAHPLGVDYHPLQLPLSWWRPGKTRPPPRLPRPPAPPRLLRSLSHKRPPLPLNPLSSPRFLSTQHLNLESFSFPDLLSFFFLSASLSPSSISNLKKFLLFSFPLSIFSWFLSSTLQISHPLIFYIILLRIITSPGCCLASFPSLPFLSPHLKSFPFNFSFSYCKNLSPKQPQFSFPLRLSDCHFS